MGVSVSGSYPVLIADIRDKSYKIMYEEFPMPHLVKPIGQGQKGNAIQWPYWDPTDDSAASTATEATDISSTASFVNASVYLVASEFAKRSIITYNVFEDERTSNEIKSEHSRRHGIAHGISLEAKLLAHFSNFSTAVTSTSTSGLNIGDVMAAYSLLDGQKVTAPKPYNCVVHPYAWYYFGVNTTSNSNYGVQGQLGEKVLQKFHLTTLLGDVRVFKDPQISISSSVATCGMFSKDAIGLWRPRKYTMKSDEDISLRGYELVSSMRVGSAELVDAFGVKMSLYAGTPS